MRCFKLMHYGININDTVPKGVEEILYLVNSDDKFTIFMCDFLSLSNKIISISFLIISCALRYGYSAHNAIYINNVNASEIPLGLFAAFMIFSL